MSAYASGDALGTAITQRLRNTFGAVERTRRRDEVAYRRLVARLAVADPLTGIPEVDELPPGLRVLAWPSRSPRRSAACSSDARADRADASATSSTSP